MNNQDEWNEFLGRLFGNALNTYQSTKEYAFLKEKQEQIHARVAERCEQDSFLDDCAFAMGLDHERKSEFVYRKGMQDCVVILKELGVLA